VCFASEANGRIALAFTDGYAVRFIELDLSKTVEPLEERGPVSDGGEMRVIHLDSDPTFVKLSSIGGGRLRHLVYEAPPRPVGITRVEGKWLFFVDLAGTLVTLARGDGEDNWVLLENPVAP